MGEFTTQQKAQAMNGLAQISVRVREDGSWYVIQNVEIKKGSMLHSVSGNGETPTDAIEDHWDTLTSLNGGDYLVLRAASKSREAVRWNGFMWEPIYERD